MTEQLPPSGKKVLIIDDDPAFSELLGQWLGVQGIEIEIASSGEEGIEKAASWAPGLIVLDVMMPGIHGVEVLRRLRADLVTTGIPVIILTGITGEEFEFDAAKLNAEVFRKGGDPKKLSESIMRRMSRLA